MKLIMGDGLLGSELVRQTSWDYISRKKDDIQFTFPNTYKYMLPPYDEIINCIAYTETYSEDKRLLMETNYHAVMELVDICNTQHKKLIHISTDYVYANNYEFASEEDIPLMFDNWYVYSKALADAYIKARCKNYLIVRCSFKPRPFPWDVAWDNLIGNFDYIDTIAGLIIRLIEKGATGIYNVGTGVKSMYGLALQTKPDCLQGSHTFPPYNITMNLKKLHGLLFNNYL